MINRLNKDFVSTSIIIDDLEKRAKAGDPLAQPLMSQWQYPVEMFFVTPAGKLVSKLNSFEDFPGVHPDVVAPPRGKHVPVEHERTHIDVFMKHVTDHFGSE